MRTVIVTGASRGIGLAIAQHLTDLGGYRVVGVSRTLTPAFQALVEATDGRVVFRPCDLSDLDAIQPLVKDIVRDHGPIWGLVNNAGLARDGLLATMHRSDITAVMTVNLIAPLMLTKFVSRSMMAAREGRIVNISSIIATTGFNGLSVYAASKAGIEGMSRSLARELGVRNITVNCVAPGYMMTEMTSSYDEHQLAAIRRRTAVGMAEPRDAAQAVAFLLGPGAARITGTVVTVDGGSTA